MAAGTDCKVECDLLCLLVRLGVEATLLVREELVRQGRGGDIGDEAGKKPGEERGQSHGCGMAMRLHVLGRLIRIDKYQDSLALAWGKEATIQLESGLS